MTAHLSAASMSHADLRRPALKSPPQSPKLRNLLAAGPVKLKRFVFAENAATFGYECGAIPRWLPSMSGSVFAKPMLKLKRLYWPIVETVSLLTARSTVSNCKTLSRGRPKSGMNFTHVIVDDERLVR